MQAERCVAFSPQVANPSLAFGDKRLDTKVLESSSELEPRLATTNNKHDRLLIWALALALLTPLFRPCSELRLLLPQRTGKLREAM
jgi:hypothetical protein